MKEQDEKETIDDKFLDLITRTSKKILKKVGRKLIEKDYIDDFKIAGKWLSKVKTLQINGSKINKINLELYASRLYSLYGGKR